MENIEINPSAFLRRYQALSDEELGKKVRVILEDIERSEEAYCEAFERSLIFKQPFEDQTGPSF